ncbi:MFS transporter [Plasticicumulans sp.]|uniref:MFS transporter n=2 Tax=Plasticicumulans sp. TaxID=2307179 RepID=UPI00321FA651
MRNPFRALASANYRRYWLGQSVSLLGTWLQQVAMGWLAWRLSGSPALLGLIGFCANAGVLVLGPFAGVLVDRIDRRRALWTTQCLAAVQAGGLAALTLAGRIEVWHLVALALALGAISALDLPLRQALQAELVGDRTLLPNAIALNSLSFNVARALGPALAGALVAALGEGVCFALNALSYVAVLAALARIDWPPPPPRAPPVPFAEHWREGLRYARDFAPLAAALGLLAPLSLAVGPYATLMPVVAREVYGGGPHTLGWLLSAAGAGAIAGTLALAARERSSGYERIAAASALAAATGLLGLAAEPPYALALGMMMLIGGGMMTTAAALNSLLQTVVEPRLRGRAMSLYVLAFAGVFPLGALMSGLLAGHFGVQATLALAGLGALAVVLHYLRRLPRLSARLAGEYRRLGLDG